MNSKSIENILNNRGTSLETACDFIRYVRTAIYPDIEFKDEVTIKAFKTNHGSQVLSACVDDFLYHASMFDYTIISVQTNKGRIFYIEDVKKQ